MCIHTILLTIDLAPDQAIAVLKRAGVDGIQPYGEHGGATAAAAVEAGYVVLNPRRTGTNLDLSAVAGIPLLDTPGEALLGGTGRTFDWSHVANLNSRFVLAGGLGPDNVAAAIQQVGPWGVDASSRLEKSPGRKDHGMVADFIAKAKNT
jgi:phosphoribosylanthranilate isomerase